MLFVFRLFPQQPETRLNPTVKQIVDSISEERIAATLQKLQGFGTRYILSSQDDPVHGIGAAKRWIHDELQSYSPRLQVSYQNFSIKKGARRGQVIRDVDLSNIVAVLPGTTEKDHYVLVSAHYDSVALVRKPYTGIDQLVAEGVRQGIDESEERRYLKILPPERELGPLDFEATAAQTDLARRYRRRQRNRRGDGTGARDERISVRQDDCVRGVRRRRSGIERKPGLRRASQTKRHGD